MAYAFDSRRSCRRRTEANGDEQKSYGALNAIGGVSGYGRYIYTPWNRCVRPPIDPIYRGPCPPNPDGSDFEDVYGSFFSSGTLAVTGSSPTVTTEDGATFRRIELNGTALISEEGIIKERTRILIVDPGVYFIAYTLRVPEDAAIDTVLALLYDREIIPGTAAEARKTITGTGLTVSGQALIGVDGNGAEIVFGSTDTFSLTPGEFASIASLTLFSIA